MEPIRKRTATPEEVARAIHKNITMDRGITIAEAGRILGKSPQSMYNILKGDHRISLKVAHEFNNNFGYSVDFLTKGLGTLLESASSFEDEGDGLHFDLDEINLGNWAFYTNPQGFSERETFLNDVAKIYQLAYVYLNNKLQLGVFSGVPDINPDMPDIFESETEKVLFRSILFSHYYIMNLINPDNVVKYFREEFCTSRKEEK